MAKVDEIFVPSRNSGRLKIVHYLPGIKLELGGVVRAVLDLCNVLAARGHEITVVTYDSTDVPKEWDGKDGRPRVVWLPPSRLDNGPVSKEAVEIWSKLLPSQDVAHLHCPWTLSNIQLAKAAPKIGKPYVVSIHGMLSNWALAQRRLKKIAFLYLGVRKYLVKANCLHFTADEERDQAMKWLKGAKTAVIPCLVDLLPYENLPGPELARAAFPAAIAPEPKLLFLSRLHEKKGLHILIDAVSELRQAGRKLRLLVAGSGDANYTRAIKEQVERLGLQDVVYFLGMVSGMTKISLFQAADLYVLPTLQENFGLVFAEAMASRLQVVTTRGTDIWRELQGAGAVVVDPNEPHAFATAIGDILDHPANYSDNGERGRQWVMDSLSIDRISQQYEDFYGRVIATAGLRA